MKEGDVEKRQYQRQSINREKCHEEFVKSGKFDVLPVKQLNIGDRVVIKEKAAVGTVREIDNQGVISISFEGGGGLVAQVTRNASDVRHAEDYERVLGGKV